MICHVKHSNDSRWNVIEYDASAIYGIKYSAFMCFILLSKQFSNENHVNSLVAYSVEFHIPRIVAYLSWRLIALGEHYDSHWAGDI